MSHALTNEQISALEALKARLGDLETLIPLSATGGFVAIFNVPSIRSTLFLEIDEEAQLLKLTEQSAHTGWQSWEFEAESACFRAVEAIIDGTHGSSSFGKLVGEIFEEDLNSENRREEADLREQLVEDIASFGLGLAEKLHEAGDKIRGWVEEFAENNAEEEDGTEDSREERGAKEEAEIEEVLTLLLGDGAFGGCCSEDGCCGSADEQSDPLDERPEPDEADSQNRGGSVFQDFLDEAFEKFPQSLPGGVAIGDPRETVAGLLKLLNRDRSS